MCARARENAREREREKSERNWFGQVGCGRARGTRLHAPDGNASLPAPPYEVLLARLLWIGQVLVTRSGKRGWLYGHPLAMTSGEVGLLAGGWFPAAFIAKRATSSVGGRQGAAGVVARDKGHHVERDKGHHLIDKGHQLTESVTPRRQELNERHPSGPNPRGPPPPPPPHATLNRERVSRAVDAFLRFHGSFDASFHPSFDRLRSALRRPAAAPKNGASPPPFSGLHPSCLHPNPPVSSWLLPPPIHPRAAGGLRELDEGLRELDAKLMHIYNAVYNHRHMDIYKDGPMSGTPRPAHCGLEGPRPAHSIPPSNAFSERAHASERADTWRGDERGDTWRGDSSKVCISMCVWCVWRV